MNSTVKSIFTRILSTTRRVLDRPEKFYLWTAISVLLGFALITPPFQGPDEESHYVRVQYIANGHLVPSEGMELPTSIMKVAKLTFYDKDIRSKTNQNYEIGRTKEALKIPYNTGEFYKPVLVTYNPTLYLPAVPGVALANALNLSPLISLYIARISLGLVAILILFLSIKLVPNKKYLLVAVALIPTLIYQQSVVNADGVSYALLALFIAYILNLRQRNTIERKNWLILSLLFVGVFLAKPLLYVFLPLVLVLIKRRYAKQWLAGMAILGTALYLIYSSLSSAYPQTIYIAGTPQEVNSAAQVHTLTEEPKRGLRVLWNSYMTSYGDDEARGVIGIFGAADVIYPLWMVTVYIAILTIAAFIKIDDRKKESKPVHRYWRTIAIGLCAVYFVGVNLALYLGYTPVNFDIVYGVQGRYFLPIVIILAMIVLPAGMALKYRKDENRVKLFIALGIIGCLLLALFITYQRYFLYTP